MLKESTEANGWVMVKWLHQRLEMVIYPLWPGSREHGGQAVSDEDLFELSSRQTDGTNGNKDCFPCILEKT